MLNKTAITSALTTEILPEQIAAFANLFKVVPHIPWGRGDKIGDVKEGIEMGVLFVDRYDQPSAPIRADIFDIAVDCYGDDRELFNHTFYKSFGEVGRATELQLILDQAFHYFTVYSGYPAYIPMSKLEIPLKDYHNADGRITVIRVLPLEDCIDIFDNYLKNLAAPSQNQMPRIKALLPLSTLAADDIKSFELCVIKHKLDGTLPEHPVSVLRYLVYEITGQTLLIKNRDLCNAIKYVARTRTDTLDLYRIIMQANDADIASIFFRYKPIFLAMKEFTGFAPWVNRIRRLADTYHKPLSPVCVQNYFRLPLEDRLALHDKMSNRDIIKLINSTGRASYAPRVFSIRNGKTFVADGEQIPEYVRGNERQLYRVLVDRLRPVLNGKTFYIPSHIDYAAPTTEKQYTGNIPWGTAININKAEYSFSEEDAAYTIGVHWFNRESTKKDYYDDDGRVDIDLHLNSATEHLGWNGGCRYGGSVGTGENEIIYTGDQVTAPLPNGAAEAFYFKPFGKAYVVSAHLYTDQDTESAPIEYTLFMNKTKPNPEDNYIYNPALDMFPPIKLSFNNNLSASTIGLFLDTGFYFYGGTLNNTIVPAANYPKFIAGLQDKLEGRLSIATLLVSCGASIITDKNDLVGLDNLEDVISLAPEDLTISTLMDIVDGNII